ncbi:hypothetical protein LEP1GSC049_1041 [Leptospira kirschneri serovar Cynopteri str. 3522 CT]|uniref:Uncharacterized protein n=1 Tax=Leptospira kirschneri str. 200802841 TaxID=1193047 RepID=A0A828Y272_9LEPT|nr:hypothetical protein LEP1GSC044_1822 [Leptospira kirschneri serovar Grippotyphosa str. RM52]EKO50239.1 hypothetical protein LEP1GSC131_2749 [Leptospira kirschneri str. 200802841]EKQ82129.1 hypothetical protein LEP1GSC064_4163 [Leptospira kirschneri serovar Grippotyphosa str. Moskva]EKR07067.1 hypothetical protein LEP1GSC122_3684 [Leptospira kirschneri serovar Valbuzzi str. 200702274]EMK01294.1 hypothetical protein LEP1GSC176_1248 [Leptospira kirschneri str. MMD1493]EMK16506.1 hypothetical p
MRVPTDSIALQILKYLFFLWKNQVFIKRIYYVLLTLIE